MVNTSMAVQTPLPRFRKPPVSEVAVGVQFGTPTLNPVHLGLFYQRVRAKFPNIQVQPPLSPASETFGPAPPVPFAFPMIGALSPRLWFVSDDDTSLIQLQADRLIFNWRSGAEHSSYPHFDAVRTAFLSALDDLEAVASSENLGDVAVNQCEVIYVNPLPTVATGVLASMPERVLRTWNRNPGKEWEEPLEDLSFNARYRLEDADGQPFGRLTVGLTSGWGSDGSPVFQLGLTARGVPRGAGRDGVIAFHEYAHQAIVRCFTGLTTPEMHERWERYQ